MRVEWIRNEVRLIAIVGGVEMTITMTPGMAEVTSRGLSLGASHARSGEVAIPAMPVEKQPEPSPLVGLDGGAPER